MNFISRYKSNSSRRQTALHQFPDTQQAVKVNLNNEYLANAIVNSENQNYVDTSNESQSISENPNSNDAKKNSNIESIILFKSDNYSKMPAKDIKRQSKSASSLLRRLLTCGGVVASCSGHAGNKSESNSRRSSRSGYLEIQIPDIILTHPDTEQKMSLSQNSLPKLKDHKTICYSEPNLPVDQPDEDQMVPEDKQAVLPVIKLNDDVLTSENCEELVGEDESEDENAVDQDYDDYSDEEDEQEYDLAKMDDESSFQNNIASIIIEEADEAFLNDTQVFDEEEECSVEKDNKLNADLSSTTIPSFSFEMHSDDQEKSESLNKSLNKLEEAETDGQKPKSCPKIANYNSKFLTANNILTDRGCLVNIRTGSFNLGCQSAASSTSLSQDKYLNDEELIDSNEFFSSLQHENGDFRNSTSNYSFRSYNGSLESNALNLLIPFLLIKNRHKSSNLMEEKSSENLYFKNQSNNEYKVKSSKNTLGISMANSNLLSASCNSDQDQVRRCSHDPNIEKLHKTYIENVKLSGGQAFSSSTNIYSTSKNDSANANNSSINRTSKNPIKALKFSENFMSLDSNQNLNSLAESEDKLDLEAEKNDVLNEIHKVDKWLIDNRNNQLVQKNELNKRIMKKLPSVTVSEDEDNSKSVDSSNDSSKMKMNHFEDENDENNNCAEPKAKYSNETNDSAIDIRSYGSISTLSKASSSKSRVNWQSFSKSYHCYFFQSMNTTWSKYQIAAMSLEQLMALRKLALIQFSKLVERQHSSMISVNEFQRVYDSIDFSDPENNSKSKSAPNSNQTANPNSKVAQQINQKESAILIGNRKVSTHLGAKLGHYLSNERISNTDKKKRRRNSIKKSDNIFPIEPILIVKDEASVSSNQLELIESLVIEKSSDQIQNVKKKLVFGVSLSSIMQLSGQPLPQPILESMRFIRKIAATEIGVFRKNGNKSRIKKLKESIDNNEAISFVSSDLSVFDVADTLKLYFRELPECLITNKLSDILLANYSRIRPEERKTTLQQVMLLIPDENRLVLQTLLLFLNDIAKNHRVNQMSRNNLAVIFSPVIFSMNFDPKKKHKHLKNIATLPVNLNLANNNETTNIENIKISTNKSTECQSSSSRPIFDLKDANEENNQEKLELELKQNSNYELGLKPDEIQADQPQSKLLSVPNENLNSTNTSSKSSNQSNLDINSNLAQIMAQNSKRKYSNRLNKAASTIVNFSRAELGTTKTSGFFFDSVKDNLESLEYMNKVVQLCVSDMIKYSMDLFTVPVENFEKLRLSVSFGSEPHNLDYFYDKETKCIKRTEFFTNNIKIDKINWFYFDKFEDVSIYYFKNDILFQSLLKNVESVISGSGIQSSISTNRSVANSLSIQINESTPVLLVPETFESIQSSFAFSQQNESFNDKLKLWKCCTLIKSQNLTIEKILTRIKDERKLWDDDFRDGKVVEKLDSQTELYRYVISFMPPHPSRDFFEIRHFSYQVSENPTLILTSTSVKHQVGNKLVGDIRSNLIISKYVIEKLISTDTITAFKITHYIKMDYKGFTMEFYNKTFGYMMARLLYNLKMSLLSSH